MSEFDLSGVVNDEDLEVGIVDQLTVVENYVLFVVVRLQEDIFVDEVVEFRINFAFFIADDDCFSVEDCLRDCIQVFLTTRLVEYLLRLDFEIRDQPVLSLLLRIE